MGFCVCGVPGEPQSAVGYPQCLHSLSMWAGTAQAKDKEQGTEGMLLQSLAFSQALA